MEEASKWSRRRTTMEKKAFPGIVRHRHQKPVTFDKAIKPDTGWVSGSGEHDGDIKLADIYRPAVARDDIDLGPALEVHSGPRRQLCVGFDRRHTTSGSDNLGQHRRIVSGAGTDLKYLLAGGDVKMVKIAGPEAGHPIVGENRVDSVGDRGDQSFEEGRGGGPFRLLDQLHEGELTGAIDGEVEVELGFSGLELSNVDVEIIG
ncbi:hypothetical protein ACVWXL_000374 [Bradyrhizobium sp. GM22.5]